MRAVFAIPARATWVFFSYPDVASRVTPKTVQTDPNVFDPRVSRLTPEWAQGGPAVTSERPQSDTISILCARRLACDV